MSRRSFMLAATAVAATALLGTGPEATPGAAGSASPLRTGGPGSTHQARVRAHHGQRNGHRRLRRRHHRGQHGTGPTGPTGPTQPTGPAPSGAITCPIFPSDNPWNQDVSHLPVDPNSDNYIASIGASTNLHPDFGSNPSYGIPYVVVGPNQPQVPITFTAYGSESDPGPYPVPLDAPVEAGSDRHVLTLQNGTCKLYEMFDAQRSGSGWDAGSGAVFDLRSNALRPDGWTSADAAGLPILPGLVRYDEVQSGHIDHALRFTVRRTQKGYIHPATHYASSSTDPNLPPMGLRLRLKASYDISRFTGAARVILEALRKYGMFVADNGSDWYISGSTDSRWNDTDLDQLKSVAGSAFEVVQTGPILHASS